MQIVACNLALVTTRRGYEMDIKAAEPKGAHAAESQFPSSTQLLPKSN